MEVLKTGNVLFLEHQKNSFILNLTSNLIPRPSFTLKQVKTSFLLHGNAQNQQCSILEHQKTASYLI